MKNPYNCKDFKFAMANSKELFRELVNKIQLAESKEEIESVVYLLLEKSIGIDPNRVS